MLDFGSQAEDNNAVLKAQHIIITAETQGAKSNLLLNNYSRVNTCSFRHLLPYRLHLVVCTTTPIFPHLRPLHPPYFARPNWRITVRLRFRLYDLSLGGMGALLETAKPAGLHEGMRFAQIEVNMGQWGMFFTLTPS
ncbi:hypothetical protein DJICPGNB_03720 [Escherichia coli]|nr:hypothetical protein DJICPGNB_03720 [Escherichia coli]